MKNIQENFSSFLEKVLEEANKVILWAKNNDI